ncbi:hypothetical protein [Streptomyces sp. NPDC056061]|uniref:hypothetical protein n=1 Tax=Streptomyces sp. NPDC056061 TaxID=3345700 RepID=UPI0035DA9890
MGSLRNPIGPLPSTIYWRRRAVALALVALLAALIVWAVTSRGGKGTTDDSRSGASNPAHAITPGPTPSGSAITQQPGGRDESDDSEDGDTGGAGAGSGGGAGTGGNGAVGTGTGSGSAGGSGATAARQIPAGSPLPDCTPGSLQLTLNTEVSYAPGEKPKFRLIARNTSTATCKADFGPKSAVLTVTEAGGDDSQVWSTQDCPRTPGNLLLEFPAGATVVHTVEWDLRKSVAQCATPAVGTAGPGTYLVEAKVSGQPVRKGTPPRASFVLAKD